MPHGGCKGGHLVPHKNRGGIPRREAISQPGPDRPCRKPYAARPRRAQSSHSRPRRTPRCTRCRRHCRCPLYVSNRNCTTIEQMPTCSILITDAPTARFWTWPIEATLRSLVEHAPSLLNEPLTIAFDGPNVTLAHLRGGRAAAWDAWQRQQPLSQLLQQLLHQHAPT